MSAALSTLADLNSKTADANTQAQAAISEVVNLQPDKGNQTQMHSNTAALKDARSKLINAQHDLIAARKDVGVIIRAIEGIGNGASATSTNSASTSSATTSP